MRSRTMRRTTHTPSAGEHGYSREASMFKIWRESEASAYFGEELVVEDLIQGESVARVFLQDS